VLGGYPFGWLESWVLVLVSTKSDLGLVFWELELMLNPDPVLEPNFKLGPAGSGTGIKIN
jgi:hypothetical protein